MEARSTRSRSSSLAQHGKAAISAPELIPALRPAIPDEYETLASQQIRAPLHPAMRPKQERSHIRQSSSDLAASALASMLSQGSNKCVPAPVPGFHISPIPTTLPPSRPEQVNLVTPSFEFQPHFDDFQLEPVPKSPKSSWEEDESDQEKKRVRQKKLRKERDAESKKKNKFKTTEGQPVPAIPARLKLDLPEINTSRFSVTSVFVAGNESLLKFEEERQKLADEEAEKKVPLLRVLNDDDWRSQHTKSPAPWSGPGLPSRPSSPSSSFRPISPSTSFRSVPQPIRHPTSVPSSPVLSKSLGHSASRERDTRLAQSEQPIPKRSRRRSFGRIFNKKSAPNLGQQEVADRKRAASIPSAPKVDKPVDKLIHPPLPSLQSAQSYPVQRAPSRPHRSCSSPTERTHFQVQPIHGPPSRPIPELPVTPQQKHYLHPVHSDGQAYLLRPRGASHGELPARDMPQSQSYPSHLTNLQTPAPQYANRTLRPMRSMDSIAGTSQAREHVRSPLATTLRPRPSHPPAIRTRPLSQAVQTRPLDSPMSPQDDDPFARAQMVHPQYQPKQDMPAVFDSPEEKQHYSPEPEGVRDNPDSSDIPLVASSALARSNSVASLIDPMLDTRRRPRPAVPKMPIQHKTLEKAPSRAPITKPYHSPYTSRRREETVSSLTSGDESETTTTESHGSAGPEPAIYDYSAPVPSSPFGLASPDLHESPVTYDSKSRTLAADLRKRSDHPYGGIRADV